MPRSPLTEPLLKVQGMITYVRENLSTDEYMLFLDLLAPEPEPAKKPQKKAGKKSAGKGAGKSARASSLQQQIQTARPALDGSVSKIRCDLNGCGQYADANIHHLSTTEGYHEFMAQPAAHAASSGE